MTSLTCRQTNVTYPITRDSAWDEGTLTEDSTVHINECAGVLQYAQTVFEGLKAYTTEDGHIVTFRPDLNAERLENSALRLEIPPFPKDRFIDAVTQVVSANAAYVPPLWFRCLLISASLYIWKQRCNRRKTCG